VGSILGAIFLVHQTGAAIGSWLAGALFESTGGYGLVDVIACTILVGAAPARRAHRRRPPAPALDPAPGARLTAIRSSPIAAPGGRGQTTT
jgi:hypothetical protein